jgi:hypothetical protein
MVVSASARTFSCLAQSQNPAEAVGRAQKASAMLFDSDHSKIIASELTDALRSDRNLIYCLKRETIGRTITSLAVKYGIVPSNSESFFYSHATLSHEIVRRCCSNVDHAGRFVC